MVDVDEYLLQSEEDQYKEVYARFGRSIFYFQVLEHQLINMIASYHKVRNVSIPPSDIDDLFKEFSDKTMGRLITKVVSLYSLDPTTKKELWALHRKRNFYAHHYFKTKSFSWELPAQRVEMVREIDEATERAIEIDGKLTSILIENLGSIGISDADLEDLTEKMKSGEIQEDVLFVEEGEGQDK